MFNKNNQQTHYGKGDQYIDQSITNNVFLTYGDPSPSDSTNNPAFLAILLLIVTLTLGNLLLGFVQEHKVAVIVMQVVLLFLVNSYVYVRSRDTKLLVTEIVPSILSILTTVFSVNNQIPTNFQSVLDKMNTSLDFSSYETIINGFLNGLLPKTIELLSEYSHYTVIFTTVYIILVLLVVFTPLLIGINALFKNSVQNYFAYAFIIAYWIFFFVLKTIQ